jgi:hypothetical protein
VSPHSASSLHNFQAKYGREALDTLRSFLLGRWRRRVQCSLSRFLCVKYGRDWWANPIVTRDIEAGRDCIQKAANATWWDWSQGSTPFFWRRPPDVQPLVQDGHPPWFLSKPPRYVRPPRPVHACSIFSFLLCKYCSTAYCSICTC